MNNETELYDIERLRLLGRNLVISVKEFYEILSRADIDRLGVIVATLETCQQVEPLRRIVMRLDDMAAFAISKNYIVELMSTIWCWYMAAKHGSRRFSALFYQSGGNCNQFKCHLLHSQIQKQHGCGSALFFTAALSDSRYFTNNYFGAVGIPTGNRYG